MTMVRLRRQDPRIVGSYRLLRRLGAGGMGVVYLGVDRHGTRVALKLIRQELAGNPEFRSRFAREVAAAAMVRGNRTAALVDADAGAERPWLATVYVPGPSLQRRVGERGPMGCLDLARIGSAVADGLVSVHAVGVVHRDVKPSNILLSPDGPQIIDFGIAYADGAGTLTVTGTAVGSPGFLAPEQVRGQTVTPATDIFALGVTLAYAGRGAPPFGSGPVDALLYRVVHEEPDLEGVPEQVVPLISACLSKDPRMRPTAEQVRERLAAIARRREAERGTPARGTAASSTAAPAAMKGGAMLAAGPRERDRERERERARREAARREGARRDEDTRAERSAAQRAEAGRPETGRAEPGRGSAEGHGTGRSESGRQDGARHEATRPDAARHDARGHGSEGQGSDRRGADGGRADHAARHEPGRGDAGRHEPRQESARHETRPDGGRHDTGRPDAGRGERSEASRGSTSERPERGERPNSDRSHHPDRPDGKRPGRLDHGPRSRAGSGTGPGSASASGTPRRRRPEERRRLLIQQLIVFVVVTAIAALAIAAFQSDGGDDGPKVPAAADPAPPQAPGPFRIGPAHGSIPIADWSDRTYSDPSVSGATVTLTDGTAVVGSDRVTLGDVVPASLDGAPAVVVVLTRTPGAGGPATHLVELFRFANGAPTTVAALAAVADPQAVATRWTVVEGGISRIQSYLDVPDVTTRYVVGPSGVLVPTA
ncbi:protein kinase [Embleya sp. NPDC020630]|uniref:serine/threonine protein kinase n=1 Tax=Embleya sp. NPDC020630 TaxID=3363979 RepID=UPI00378C7B83